MLYTTIALIILKVIEDYITYYARIQDPWECEKICEVVKRELSKVVKLISCKIHGFSKRKKLIGPRIYSHYKMLRVKIKYIKRKRERVTTLTVYPSDIVPYVRRTLSVLEKISREKFIFNKTYYELEKIYDVEFDFSYNGIRSSIERVKWAFDRLLKVGIVNDFNITSWLRNENRSFSQLSLLYRRKFYPKESSMSCVFSR